MHAKERRMRDVVTSERISVGVDQFSTLDEALSTLGEDEVLSFVNGWYEYWQSLHIYAGRRRTWQDEQDAKRQAETDEAKA